MTAYELTYYVAIAIIIYRAAFNMLAFIRNPELKFLFFFALMELTFAFFQVIMLNTINVDDIERALVFERIENAVIPILGVFFLLFLHHLRKILPDKLIYALIGVFILESLIILLMPNSYTVEMLAPKTFKALDTTIYETEQPLWVQTFLVFNFLIAMVMLNRYFRGNISRIFENRIFMVMMGLFSVSFLIDILVALQIIHMVYTAHLGFVLLVFGVENLFKIRLDIKPGEFPAGNTETVTRANGSPTPVLVQTETIRMEEEEQPGRVVRINCLGPLSISMNDKEIPQDRIAKKKKMMKLFKLLLINFEKGVHREAAIESLWPDLSEQNATNNLHALCFRLRKILEIPETIVFNEDRIYFNSTLVETDYTRFQEYTRKGVEFFRLEKKTEAIPFLNKAGEYYRGDFFEFDLYMEEAEPQRNFLKQKHKDSLLILCRLYINGQEYDSLLETSRQAIHVDNLDEDAWRFYFQALYLCGKKNEVLKKYEELKKLLKTELDTEPDPQTEELVQSIKENRPVAASGG